MKLSDNFRFKTINERREEIKEKLNLSSQDHLYDLVSHDLLSSMIENYVGFISVPVGIVRELKVNNKLYNIPIATEEPSVIAAANFGSKILKEADLKCSVEHILGIAQVFIKSERDITNLILSLEEKIKISLEKVLSKMKERGGGYRHLKSKYLKDVKLQKLNVYIDTCDAMGANLLNTVSETLAKFFKSELNLEVPFKILSNSLDDFPIKANFSLPLSHLNLNEEDNLKLAQEIGTLSLLANLDEERALTNNKGIMNAITGFALATFNDIRALEASAHKFASKTGIYKPFSSYKVQDGFLHGKIEIPLSAGIIGGAIDFHPSAQLSLSLSGIKTRRELLAVMASLGLVQNFAALRAIALEGIQKGHMRLHIKKKLYILREEYNLSDNEINLICSSPFLNEKYNIQDLKKFIKEFKNKK